MKQAGKYSIRLLNKLIDIAFACFLFILFIVGSFALWDTQLLYQKAESSQFEVYRPNPYKEQPFAELQRINEDIFAWIHLYGTSVDYPVLYAHHASEYINKDPFGNYTSTGSLFVNAPAHMRFQDFNTIIHGHNMEHRAMFGQLKEYESYDFMSAHRYGQLTYTNDQGVLENKGIVVVAFLNVDAYDSGVYAYAITNPAQQQAYRTSLLTKASVVLDTPYTDERLLLLSTCSPEETNGRNMVVCYLTDETYPDTFVKEKKFGIGIDKLQGWFGFPWLGWIALGIVIILLILIGIWIMDQKRKARLQAQADTQLIHPSEDIASKEL